MLHLVVEAEASFQIFPSFKIFFFLNELQKYNNLDVIAQI